MLSYINTNSYKKLQILDYFMFVNNYVCQLITKCLKQENLNHKFQWIIIIVSISLINQVGHNWNKTKIPICSVHKRFKQDQNQ